MLVIAQHYLPKGDYYDPRVDRSEYMMAGAWTKPETVQKFPRIRMITGQLCPMKDENIFTVSKFLKKGVRDIKLFIFRHMPHGFVNFGIPLVGKKTFLKAHEKIRDLIVELIEAPEL